MKIKNLFSEQFLSPKNKTVYINQGSGSPEQSRTADSSMSRIRDNRFTTELNCGLYKLIYTYCQNFFYDCEKLCFLIIAIIVLQSAKN